MGWNDRYDPSEYDASDPDSMRDLAVRSMRDHPAPVKDTAPAPDSDKGECWDCGATAKLVYKGLCGWCYYLDNR